MIRNSSRTRNIKNIEISLQQQECHHFLGFQPLQCYETLLRSIMFHLQGFYILQLLSFVPIQIVADQALERLTLTWFDDYDCQKYSGQFASPPSEQIDSCHQMATPAPHSFLVNENSGPCAVIFYGDPECTFNATKAPAEHPLGYCVGSAHLFGFALECTSSASTSPRTTAPPKATASSFKSASSSPASGGGSRALSTAAKIAIGVAPPVVIIIVGIIFGVRMRNRRRKAKGFVEIQMDNKGETSTNPQPEEFTETQADSKTNYSKASELGPSEGYDSQSYPSKQKMTDLRPSNPWESNSLRPNESDTLPRYTTGNSSTMPAELSDNPVHGKEVPPTLPTGFAELPTTGLGGYSEAPGGYAELPINNWQGQPSMPSGAAESPMGSTGGHSNISRGNCPVNH